MNKRYALMICFALVAYTLPAQSIYEYSRNDATILFFNKNLSQYIPHITRMYQNGKALHHQLWRGDLDIQPPMMMITDWADSGNGGASAIPRNIISIEMAPLNYSYFVSPSTERYHHLFCHEYTHTVMTDKAATRDRTWRRLLGGKFTVDDGHPFSALWSYLGTPRWYAPRWYHEGIACFMETWMGGGAGRALGSYDEMYFRAIVNQHHDKDDLYSVVGLETEGTVSDFQMGANSYLYGTRFVNYLALRYGPDKLIRFYDRTNDSKMMFNNQFREVFGESLRKVWDDWRTFEQAHQEEQLASLRQYTLTNTDTLTNEPLGSMSPPLLDEGRQLMYYAANFPGDLPHIEQLDLRSGKRTKICLIDDPMLYQPSYMALDTLRQRLIFTTQNNKYRSLNVVDIATRKITKKMKYQRTGDLVYDNANDCLYGIMVNGGVCYLVRYDANLEERSILFPFNFGISVYDLDVSHDGQYVSATLSEKDGGTSLVRFDMAQLAKGKTEYDTLQNLDDNNLSQFRFAKGDSTMVGTSYYTGVANIWQLNLRTKQLDLLTNTDIGLFAPLQYRADSLYALKFERNGLRPVRIAYKIEHDANAVELLGQKAYEAHSAAMEAIGTLRQPLPHLEYGEVYDSIKTYRPLRRLQFSGAYPELSGFRDHTKWNNVTPVLGYRLMFSDPLGLHTLNLSLGASPWSNHRNKHKFHAEMAWHYMQWTLNASWNRTSFYDLFGPMQTSRKGWQVTLAKERSFTIDTPYTRTMGFQVGMYGNMDALPLFQNIEIQKGIHSFQTAMAYFQAGKTRSSIGALMAEQGWTASASASTYLAKGHFYPSVDFSLSEGWLLPWRNTSLWLRGYTGQSFADQQSSFGKNYFGGFRNNYVDHGAVYRYRATNAMPGLDIDELSAHSYAKLTAELNLRPYRFNNVGMLNLYPTFVQCTLFSTALATDPWKLKLYHDGEGLANCHTYLNVGVQANMEVVMFKYLKTTWSAGYARIFMPDHTNKGQLMLSLKLL